MAKNAASQDDPGGFGGICQQATDLHRGDGSVLRGALPGSDVWNHQAMVTSMVV
jgi:hypothetical protein